MPSLLSPYILFGATVLPKTILFLVDNAAAPGARDTEINDYLVSEGWSVDYLSDEDLTGPGDLAGYGVLLVAHSVVNGNIIDPTSALGVDIGVVWVGRNMDTDVGFDDLSIGSGGETAIYINDVSHPITSFLGSVGLYTVYTTGTVLTEKTSGGDPAGTILARRTNGSGNAVLWLYDKGDTRPVGGGTFAGRRVATWIQGQGGARIDITPPNNYGQLLLKNICEWVTYRL